MRRQNGWQQDVEAWKDFWSAIAPGLAARVSTSTSTTDARFTYLPSTTASMSGGTVVVTVPGETVYVSTTIISTTFITVPATTVTLSSSQSTGARVQNISQSTFSRSTKLEPTTMSSVVITASPSAVTEEFANPPATTTPIAHANSTTDAMIGAQTENEEQKHAIIGGLSGSIAGLIFIGILICLALRMRRKRDESAESEDSLSEKGIRPALIRKWTQLTGGGVGSPKQSQMVEPSLTTVDEDHRIIKMNTRHWPRPFVAGTGEGYRESQPPGTLRVVNPDLSRPETPDTALGHFMKQRPSLAGFVFGTATKLSPDAKPQQYSVAQKPIPTITVIDPNLSQECIATYERTPSFRSYPSIASTQVVTQRPPDDPFVSPLRPRPQNTTTTPGRPSLPTWSRLSSHLLHPFARRTNTVEPTQNVRGISHFSVSSSASRSSRRSDPFDLSIRGSHAPREASEFRRGSPNPNWILYEGT